ncbi:MAG: hypothetical protein H6851_03000 [Geminicoccaceae bacterium]|nr:hypothetical protein [Geminicoccaceae bacterium]
MNRRELMASVAGMAGLATMGTAFSRAALAQDIDALVEASKAEGRMTIYSNWGEEFWPYILDPFKEKYPWTEFDYLDLGGNEILERYLIETSAGAKSGDFLQPTAAVTVEDLYGRNQFIDFQVTDHDVLPSIAKSRPGVYANALDAEVMGWNKRLLPPELVPTGLEDMANKVAANPDVFDGKIVGYPPHTVASRNLIFHLLELHHGPQFWDWMDVIAPKMKFLEGSSAMVEGIMSGTYLLCLAMPLSTCLMTMRDPARASLYDWGFHHDGQAVGGRFAGIPVATTTPNTSRLLLDYMMTKEGQAANTFAGKLSVRSDLPPETMAEDAVTLNDIEQAVGPENIVVVDYKADLEEGMAVFRERFKKALQA